MKKENTFGDYKFEEWIPEHTREIIRDFWGCFGRTYEDWLKSPSEQGGRELCHHGPGPNGFGIPKNGATVEFFIKDWGLSKEQGEDIYKIVEGKYLHRWNNMGSLIDKNGKDHTVSSCDRWVRIFVNQKEKEVIEK